MKYAIFNINNPPASCRIMFAAPLSLLDASAFLQRVDCLSSYLHAYFAYTCSIWGWLPHAAEIASFSTAKVILHWFLVSLRERADLPNPTVMQNTSNQESADTFLKATIVCSISMTKFRKESVCFDPYNMTKWAWQSIYLKQSVFFCYQPPYAYGRLKWSAHQMRHSIQSRQSIRQFV
jgi:hypothetical protein